MGRHGDWRVQGAREGGEGVGLGPAGPGCRAEEFGPYIVVDGTRGGMSSFAVQESYQADIWEEEVSRATGQWWWWRGAHLWSR